MKLLHTAAGFCVAVLVTACTGNARILTLTYSNQNISKQLDSTSNNQPVTINGQPLSAGIIEQASATCYDSATRNKTCMQDVLSSMYLDTSAKLYNCVTTTVFHLPGGDITAIGMFKLPLGDTIPPDHNFPIVGGSGVYANIYGTYTRHYRDTIYQVRLKYYRQ